MENTGNEEGAEDADSTSAAEAVLPADSTTASPATADSATADAAAAASTMADSSATGATTYPVRFTGLVREYFRIWIVALCLSILTLGIYSAWGKVRKKRYLYAHTLIDGSWFDFTGRPIAVLRGRIIAVALFGGLAIVGHFFLPAQIGFILLLLLLTPWIVVAANRFNSYNSTYRAIRFGFGGRVREAAKVYLGIGLLLIPTLGLIYPYYRMRRLRFVTEHQRYGATPFETRFLGGNFYGAYVISGLIIVAAGIVAIVGGIILAVSVGKAARDEGAPIFALIWSALIYSGYLLAFCYLRARVGNLTFNGTRVGPVQFASSLRVRDICWLYFSNIAAILCTVGLATPWAVIRMARYRAARLTLSAATPLSGLGAAAMQSATATGSEVSDLFDVDISL